MDGNDIELKELNNKTIDNDDDRSFNSESIINNDTYIRDESGRASAVDEALLSLGDDDENNQDRERLTVTINRDYLTAEAPGVSPEAAAVEATGLLDPANTQPETQPAAETKPDDLSWACICTVFCSFVLFVIGSCVLFIVYICAFRLEFNQLALVKNDFTGRVNYEQTYGPGFHMIAPWKSGIFFDKTAKSIGFNNIKIFTTDKMVVRVSFQIYYFLE
jgi:hypothetical protein